MFDQNQVWLGTMSFFLFQALYIPKARGPHARGLRVYISGKPQVPMLQLIYTILRYRAHQSANKRNMKPTITNRQYSSGYEHNFEMIYGRAEQPTKAFAKNRR